MDERQKGECDRTGVMKVKLETKMRCKGGILAVMVKGVRAQRGSCEKVLSRAW